MNIRLIAATAGASLALSVVAVCAAPRVKLSARQAETVAARHFHGRATSSKFEHEDGRWQYAVIVVRGKEMLEVEVDPNTGRILDSERTSAGEERKEAQTDRHADAMAHHRHTHGQLTHKR